MKKFFTLIMALLAINFLAAAGGVGWMVQSGHLDKAKIKQVRDLLFPPPTPVAAATQPSADSATTQPTLRLDQLMAQESGRSVSEQVDIIQRSFDEKMLELDRKQNELNDLKRQVDLANQKLAEDRQSLDAEKAALAAQEQEQSKLQSDQGFQDSLALYSSMPPKQVKAIFMTLSEDTVEHYLDAMQPRTATKIIKEFTKSPDETGFIQRVLERMRNSSNATAAAAPTDANATNAGDQQTPGSTANTNQP
ncbi:MAG: hypothetical protein ABSG31_14060 [Tepidisphaeraceae bacterium]|jgi:flagellar motility protein MotE (MotC chaperone)